MPLRLQNILSGIQGFASGSNAIVNLNLNQRFHALRFQFATGTNSAPTAIASVLNWAQVSVNGSLMIDWTPAMFTASYVFDGIADSIRTGELLIPFSSQRLAGFRDCTRTSYDLANQTSAQVLLSVATGLTNPQVVALQEFDYQRNIVPYGPNKGRYFLNPVKRARQSFTIAGSASGLGSTTDITQIPITNPIKRLILIPDNAGTLTHYEVYADNVKVDEGDFQFGTAASFVNDGFQRQAEYGVLGQVVTYSAAIQQPIGSGYTAYCLDFTYTKSLNDALTANNSLLLRVWSNNSGSQNLQIAEEFLASAYQ